MNLSSDVVISYLGLWKLNYVQKYSRLKHLEGFEEIQEETTLLLEYRNTDLLKFRDEDYRVQILDIGRTVRVTGRR
ncbi:hypothetical protein R1flu_002619 [Riccia fluitans]|uniref:Lipocalin/cytosolic fatty-acid binding domain-containing protein n=1 Tax=Riccia fluitans TaxID=41844 RepID=A0ABD1YAG2_9MARC